MFKRANVVKLVTTGGCYCIAVAVVRPHMSEGELKRILLDNGDEDRNKFCWFNNQQSYNKAKKALIDAGAYVAYQH